MAAGRPKTRVPRVLQGTVRRPDSFHAVAPYRITDHIFFRPIHNDISSRLPVTDRWEQSGDILHLPGPFLSRLPDCPEGLDRFRERCDIVPGRFESASHARREVCHVLLGRYSLPRNNPAQTGFRKRKRPPLPIRPRRVAAAVPVFHFAHFSYQPHPSPAERSRRPKRRPPCTRRCNARAADWYRVFCKERS